MSEIPADILLYALVAAGLVFWLKNLLGTRHGEERDRANPFIQNPEQQPKKAAPESESSGALPLSSDVRDISNEDPLPKNVDIQGEEVWTGISFIRQQDKQFDIGVFSSAAQDAFVIVVEAFAKDDRETLRDLLADPVYEAFVRALQDRAQKGESVETEIHAIRKMEVMDIKLDKPMAYITTRFIADETAVIKGKDGTIISGDPDRITEMNDIWVFGRDLKSKDPRWLVYETRDGDVSEDHKTPVPDTH